jgi:hypothetical protein
VCEVSHNRPLLCGELHEQEGNVARAAYAMHENDQSAQIKVTVVDKGANLRSHLRAHDSDAAGSPDTGALAATQASGPEEPQAVIRCVQNYLLYHIVSWRSIPSLCIESRELCHRLLLHT